MNPHPWARGSLGDASFSEDYTQQDWGLDTGSTSAETPVVNEDAVFETLWQQWPWANGEGEEAQPPLQNGAQVHPGNARRIQKASGVAPALPMLATEPNRAGVEAISIPAKRTVEMRDAESNNMLMQVGQTNWRKYGQKVLKGKDSEGLVRCYFRCTWPGCEVKKRVEKDTSNVEAVNQVTITGVHNHNLHQSPRPRTIETSRPQPSTSIQVSQGQTKKPKLENTSVSLDRRILGLVMQNQNNFVVADPHMTDCPVIFASRGFCNLSGFALEETLGKNCRMLQGKDTNMATVNQISQAVANKKEIHVILLNYCKNGTPFWNLLHLSPVLDVDKRLVSFVGSQVNVSAAVGAQQQQIPLPPEGATAFIKGSRSVSELNELTNVVNDMSTKHTATQQISTNQQMSPQTSTNHEMSQQMSATHEMSQQMGTNQQRVSQQMIQNQQVQMENQRMSNTIQ